MNSDWKNAKTDLPSNDRPVLAVVSGRPPYMHEGFHNKPMMAQFIRGRKPELDCWYIEGFPGWFEAEVTYWCDTPSLPDEKSANPVAAEPAPLPSKGLPEVPRSNMGRPRTIYREHEKTSQEGLQDNFTRATFIVREDLLKKLKDYAYTERETLKDVVNRMLAEFLEDKEVIELRGYYLQGKRVTNDDLSLSELAEKIKLNAEELAKFFRNLHEKYGREE